MNTTCPGCGLELPAINEPVNPKVNASAECQKCIAELSFYTLELRDAFFIHQVAVDTYGAQHYKKGAPKIGLAFALLGLCLLLEHEYTGKEVQDAHIRLAKLSKDWPAFNIPEHRGELTVLHPLEKDAGPGRDMAIVEWAASVWKAYAPEQEAVREILRKYKEIK